MARIAQELSIKSKTFKQLAVEELIKALESIKIAVEAGELDHEIELASTGLRRGFGK